MTTSETLKRKLDECHENEVVQLKDEVFKQSESIEKFNDDLYKIVTCNKEGNFTMSGLSAYLALSMCSVGARESTANEMHNVLHLDSNRHLQDVTKILAYFSQINMITLGIANRIYADEKIVVKDAFKTDLKNIFHSDVKNMDFHSEIEKTVNDVNQWCSKQTNDKIKNILTKDDIKPTTRLIVVNAVYFKAYWLEIFEARLTSLDPFYISQTETTNVSTMHWSGWLKYKDLPELDAECVAKRYRDPNFLFIVIKPKKIDGLRHLEQNLENVHLDYRTLETHQIALALPKFRIEIALDLNEYLEKLGMIEMFTEQADFKGISEVPILDPPLHVQKVLHKVFIEVNEKGTEAAAVTRPFFRGGGCTVPFQVNRPFLYRIVNIKYNLTLFSGRVVLPECP